MSKVLTSCSRWEPSGAASTTVSRKLAFDAGSSVVSACRRALAAGSQHSSGSLGFCDMILARTLGTESRARADRPISGLRWMRLAARPLTVLASPSGEAPGSPLASRRRKFRKRRRLPASVVYLLRHRDKHLLSWLKDLMRCHSIVLF